LQRNAGHQNALDISQLLILIFWLRCSQTEAFVKSWRSKYRVQVNKIVRMSLKPDVQFRDWLKVR